MRKLNLICLFFSQLAAIAQAQESGYNTALSNEENAIQYKNILPAPSNEELKKSSSEVKIPKNIKIPNAWKPFLNPANEEFWSEGNHRPDAGFVLFARNPNVESAKLWLLRMEAKSKMMQKMFPLIVQAQKELVQDGYMLDRYNMVKNNVGASFLPKEVADNLPSQDINISIKDLPKTNDLKNLTFYFLFRPGCSHCENMSKNLVGIPNVVPLQITKEPLKHFQGLQSSIYASPETVKNYDPTGETPYLIISNPKSKKLTILKGEQNIEKILYTAATVMR